MVDGLNISKQRAEELAREAGDLSAAISEAATRLDFNDEPARFLAVLHRPGEMETPSDG